MITIRLDATKPEPMYEQLYQHIRQEITGGGLMAGSRLPSKRQLAAHLHCSLNTVQAAYSQLVAEGYLDARPKSGYYVRRLEGVVALDVQSFEFRKAVDNKKEYAYDFSYQGVDQTSFPFSTWRKIARQISTEFESEFLKTGDPQGDPNLRSTISNYLRQARGVYCQPEQIVISSGTELLLLLLIQLFEKDKVFAIESPGYEKLGQIFRSNRAAFVPIALDESGMLPDQLAQSGADVACITPSHQFPTGVIMPVNRRIQLMNWANEKPGRYIIEDDYDSEFRFDGRPIPSLQGIDRAGRVIYLGSFSKSISPSLRISYMVLPPDLVRTYHDRLGFYICPVPGLDQKTLNRFIEDGHFERHLNRMRICYKDKRETLVGAVHDDLPNVSVLGANAGLHLVVEARTVRDESDLIRLADQVGVKLYGISSFYSNPVKMRGDPKLLLGFSALEKPEIIAAVKLLKQAWEGADCG